MSGSVFSMAALHESFPQVELEKNVHLPGFSFETQNVDMERTLRPLS